MMHISRRLAGFAAVGLTATLALAACADDGGDGGDETTPSWDQCADDPDACNAGDPEDGGQIIWAFEQEQASWNQQTATGNTFVLAQIVDRFLPSTGRFLPSGEWEWNLDLLAAEPQLTSEEPQTWVYQIRPEAKWNDGTDITAEDFIWVWKHNAADPELCECDPAGSGGYEAMESVVGSDNGKTVTVTMKEGQKFAEWQFLFTQMYPAHIAVAQGFDLNTPEGMKESSDYFAETQPDYSGGAFQVAEADLRQQIILERNPNYYGEPAALDQITFRIVTEQDALVTAMSSGEIDAASPQPNQDMVSQISAMPGVLSHVGAGYQWEHLDLNLENEFLADRELRRAIFTAIDINNINQRTFASFFPDVAQKMNHLFLESDTSYYQDHISGTGQGSGDEQAAMDILTAAGYTMEGDQLMTPEGEPVGGIRFVHTEGNQLRATTAQLVQQDLAEIGIDVTIETTADLGVTLSTGDFDIMIFAWVGSPAFQTSGQQFWHSEGGGNYGSYSDPEVDRLVTEALNQIDLQAVADLLNQAMEIVVNDAYVLPISDKPVYAFANDDYLNIRPNFTNSGVPYNAEEWGLAATAAAQ